jgi:hypothetical protein
MRGVISQASHERPASASASTKAADDDMTRAPAALEAMIPVRG